MSRAATAVWLFGGPCHKEVYEFPDGIPQDLTIFITPPFAFLSEHSKNDVVELIEEHYYRYEVGLPEGARSHILVHETLYRPDDKYDLLHTANFWSIGWPYIQEEDN